MHLYVESSVEKGNVYQRCESGAWSFGRGKIKGGVTSQLWSHPGKQPMWRAKEAEHMGRNAIWEPIGYRLTNF